MKTNLLISIRLLLFFTILAGIIYPLFITGISRLFFHDKSEGSLVTKNGTVIGSELLGQQFDSAYYFHSRPSAVNYQSCPSGASNLSWTDKRLNDAVISRKASFIENNLLPDSSLVPSEMLFASASGLDPHISPSAAYLQMERITISRNFTENQKQLLNALIANLKERPQYSLFGEERINVLLLNLELDKIE